MKIYPTNFTFVPKHVTEKVLELEKKKLFKTITFPNGSSIKIGKVGESARLKGQKVTIK